MYDKSSKLFGSLVIVTNDALKLTSEMPSTAILNFGDSENEFSLKSNFANTVKPSGLVGFYKIISLMVISILKEKKKKNTKFLHFKKLILILSEDLSIFEECKDNFDLCPSPDDIFI